MPPKRKHGGAGQSPQKVKTEPGAEYHTHASWNKVHKDQPAKQYEKEDFDILFLTNPAKFEKVLPEPYDDKHKQEEGYFDRDKSGKRLKTFIRFAGMSFSHFDACVALT